MNGINKVIILGRLGADPEVKTLDSGDIIANVNIATSKTWKDAKGEKKEKTEWHRIVFYKGLANIVSTYLKKGSQVYVEGELVTRSWEQNGVKKYMTEIVANQMQMVSSKETTPSEQHIEEQGEEPDTLPF